MRRSVPCFRRFLPQRAAVEMDTPMQNPAPMLNCQLTCPQCGHVSAETMPTDACIFFHQCTACSAVLRPKDGDCCVFCSYGSVACPPVQQQRGCCG